MQLTAGRQAAGRTAAGRTAAGRKARGRQAAGQAAAGPAASARRGRLRPTGRGICLALAGLVFLAVALVFERSDAFMAAITLLAAVAAGWLGGRFASPPAAFGRAMTAGTLAPGRRVEVRLAPIIGSGFIPAPDSVHDLTPWLEAEVSSDPTGTALGYSFDAPARGVYLIGPAEVTVPGPLGVVSIRHRTAPPAELVVAPNLVDVQVTMPDSESDLPQARTQAGAERVTEPAAVRDYQSGDPRRLVHWKATARRDRLMVREVVLRGLPQAWVLVDDAAPAGRAAEAALSVAASVALRLLRAGHTVHLVPVAARPAGPAPDAQGPRPWARPGAAPGAPRPARGLATGSGIRFDPAGGSGPLLEALARVHLAADGFPVGPTAVGPAAVGAGARADDAQPDLRPGGHRSRRQPSWARELPGPDGAVGSDRPGAAGDRPGWLGFSGRLLGEIGARGAVAPIYGAFAQASDQLAVELGRLAGIARPGQIWLTGPEGQDAALRRQGWTVTRTP